ncbi:metallopeptidase TldD-related protein, partial [Candidatus Latescibacterota bacterium]
CSVPDNLPSLKNMNREIRTMAEELTAMRNTPVFDESYFGPVMFEGQAVAEFFAQRLFMGKRGLLAYRKPVTSDTGSTYRRAQDETLDDRFDRRILSRDITIKALPGLKEFQGQKLIGSYPVDMEGVKPPEEVVLVENGILKTLLTNRTPTRRVRKSNGHQRPVISGSWTSNILGPSVISVASSNGKSRAELKKELLRRAREEGMEYGILVRKLKPSTTGAQYTDPMVRMTTSYGGRDGTTLSEPILVYRVYVEDGREELIRSVSLDAISLGTLRHIAGMTRKQAVHNTLATVNYSTGIPASFIVPEALLLEELEVKKEMRDFTPRLPEVPGPLTQK